MKSRRKNYLFSIISIVIGIFISLIILECILRFLGIGYARSGAIYDPYLHHVNPPSFKFIAHSPTGEFKPFSFEYNKYGFRQRDMDKARLKKYKIALMGDSFTLSRELPYDSTFSGILENAVTDSCAVLNFGVPSYGPVLYAIQWQRIVNTYKPTHVLVQLYVNDTFDDKGKLPFIQYTADGKIKSVSGPPPIYLSIKKIALKSYLIRYVFKLNLQLKWILFHKHDFAGAVGGYIEPNPEIHALSKKALLQLVDDVKKTGAEFMITVVPSKCRLQGENCKTDRDEFSVRWQIWAEENGIRFLNLIPSFQKASKNGNKLFYDRDIHFNEKGSRITAKQIMRAWPELFSTNNTP